jgi:hypothetical protein
MLAGSIRGSVAAVALLPLVAAAQRPAVASTAPGSLPRAWEVIERHLEAAGGRAAFLKLASRDVWARYEIPGRGLRGELRVLSARPGRLLIKTEYPELGTAVTGFDGSSGWTANPGSRPTLVTGGALSDLRNDALFDRYDEENLLSAETLGLAVFDGRPCVKVKVVRASGRESLEYFETSTGLFAGSTTLRDTDKGPVTMRTVVSRYQAFDGVRLPRAVRIRVGGVEQVITVMRVTHNDVDARVFALPATLRRGAP